MTKEIFVKEQLYGIPKRWVKSDKKSIFTVSCLQNGSLEVLYIFKHLDKVFLEMSFSAAKTWKPDSYIILKNSAALQKHKIGKIVALKEWIGKTFLGLVARNKTLPKNVFWLFTW